MRKIVTENAEEMSGRFVPCNQHDSKRHRDSLQYTRSLVQAVKRESMWNEETTSG